jgi:hypothetical protein
MGCCNRNKCGNEDQKDKKTECNWCTNAGSKCGYCGKYACDKHGKEVSGIWTCKACQ